jgi:hypothetical protein
MGSAINMREFPMMGGWLLALVSAAMWAEVQHFPHFHSVFVTLKLIGGGVGVALALVAAAILRGYKKKNTLKLTESNGVRDERARDVALSLWMFLAACALAFLQY